MTIEPRTFLSGALPSWGDLGNGYFRNPVLNADFSDPDIVRVGEDYYLVCSDFHFMGMPILHSRDLVNWRLAGQVYDRLDIDPAYDRMERYGKGCWAPAIRWHDGRFFVFFCTPDEGLIMCSATDPAGSWTKPLAVARIGCWEDPCPFWDDDGQAYLGHSIVGAGPIIIHRMSPDGTRLLDEGRMVYIGKIAEGTKIYKRQGWYYLVIPEGGVEIGWQTVLRSRDIYGPYERRVVLKTGQSRINGPHQGAIVETAAGESWFMHFQSAGLMGRVCHLQPVEWVDDWPVIGQAGEPVEIWRKPASGQGGPGFLPATSDDFASPDLAWQWQWNHNPVDSAWSLSERPGWLRLRALAARELRLARNCLSQRLIGSRGRVTVELDASAMADGQLAGLCFLGGANENWIGPRRTGERIALASWTAGKIAHGPALATSRLWLAADINLDGDKRFSFSFDGDSWMPLGENCDLAAGYWKGVRIALFTFDQNSQKAPADFADFRYDCWR